MSKKTDHVIGLQQAIEAGRVASVRKKLGADPNIRDALKRTPLIYACEMNKPKVQSDAQPQ